MRIACDGDQLPRALEHFQGALGEEGFSGWGALDSELSFATGAYILARELSEIKIDTGIQQVIRGRTAFADLHASDLVKLNTDGAVDPRKAKRPSCVAYIPAHRHSRLVFRHRLWPECTTQQRGPASRQFTRDLVERDR